MIASSRSYAIGMVHFQIGGGWKLVAIILGIYLTLFGGGVAIFYYADFMQSRGGAPGLVSGFGPVIVGLLMGVQGFALLLVGGYRVSSSIRHDISSRMIESHRLMPITSPNAVFGYLFGPTTPVTLFALLNLVLSCAFGASLGAPFSRMVINQGVIFSFAVFVWSVIALGTLIYRHMFFIGIAGMFLGTCTGLLFYAFTAFPGFAILMTPFLGETIFSAGIGGRTAPDFDVGYVLGIAGQAALFLLFFTGACRLYRGTYASAFTARQAMILLAVWAALSALGVYHSNKVGLANLFTRGGTYEEGLGTTQIVASIASCAALSIVTLWCFLMEDRQRPHGLVVRLITIAVTGLLCSLPAWGAGWMSTFNIQNCLITLLVSLTQVVIVYCVLRLARRLRFIISGLIAGAALLLVWVGPLVLELGRLMIMRSANDGGTMSVLGTLSPLGMLGCLWGGIKEVSFLPGMIFQCVLAALCILLVVILANRRPRLLKPPVAPPPIREPDALALSSASVSSGADNLRT